MADAPSAPKRKALDALDPTSEDVQRMREQKDTDHEIYRDAVRRPEFRRILDGAARLFKEGNFLWKNDEKELRYWCHGTAMLITSWSLGYLIDDIDSLSEDQVEAIIASVDGFCLQTDWTTLRSMLPPAAREDSGHIFGELLLHLTIKERLFVDPFWYLDGKRGPSDPGEDPTFAERLHYLFERFHQTNPEYAVLWRMQTHRLANSTDHLLARDLTFGKTNEERHAAAVPVLADTLLASKPFCWLLKEGLNSTETEARRAELMGIFRSAVRAMIYCETGSNGIPVFQGIRELGGIFRGPSEFVSLNEYTYRARRELYTNQSIIVVPQPGIVYVDSMQGSYVDMKQETVQVMGAKVIPRYVEETTQGTADEEMDVVKDEDENNNKEAECEMEVVTDEDKNEDEEDTEVDGDKAEDDKDWVEGESDC